MKKLQTIFVVLALLTLLPGASLAQNGYYTMTISGSLTDPNVNNPPNPGVGIQNLYLWFVEGCHPSGTGGMAAAEFKIVSTGWTILAFNVMNGFLETGPAPDASGKNFLMAVGSCPTGPVVAGSLLCNSAGEAARIGFTVSDDLPGLSNFAAIVDCDAAPAANQWPELVRFVGYATQDAGTNQNHGQDCNVTPVDDSSWGQVKGLYR